MSGQRPIVFWDREKNAQETEKVYGEQAVRFFYENPIGKFFTQTVLKRPLLSKIYGDIQSSPKSKSKIKPFIQKFDIAMDEYEDREFKTFNDFFTRKFKPGKRTFNPSPDVLCAPAEGRYLAFREISLDQSFPVKGSHLTPAAILGSSERASAFEGGPAFIIRLCPTDYHRFHFPDNGKVEEHFRVPGKLHSVNPIALESYSKIFMTNERQVSLLDTEYFGKLAYIEVGAVCVGKIQQTHALNQPFNKGDEKGYFEFGGSTLILFGEKGKWKPDEDLLKISDNQMETFVKLGQQIATRI